MPRRRTPAEKKRLERARDHFDDWGENQKAARRNLPLIRARHQRAYRRAVAVELLRGIDADPGRLTRTKWRKWSGPAVGVGLADKQAHRTTLAESPRRSPEARARRAVRRSGKRH